MCFLSLFFHLQVPPETESMEGTVLKENEHISHPGITTAIFFFLAIIHPLQKFWLYYKFSEPLHISVCPLWNPPPFPSDSVFWPMQHAPKSCLFSKLYSWEGRCQFLQSHVSQNSGYICQVLSRTLSHLLWSLSRTRVLSSISPEIFNQYPPDLQEHISQNILPCLEVSWNDILSSSMGKNADSSHR